MSYFFPTNFFVCKQVQLSLFVNYNFLHLEILLQNYSHYEQSHNELSSGRACNFKCYKEKEAELTAMLQSFTSPDVSRKPNVALAQS